MYHALIATGVNTFKFNGSPINLMEGFSICSIVENSKLNNVILEILEKYPDAEMMYSHNTSDEIIVKIKINDSRTIIVVKDMNIGKWL